MKNYSRLYIFCLVLGKEGKKLENLDILEKYLITFSNIISVTVAIDMKLYLVCVARFW